MSKNILIADDSLSIRELVKYTLIHAGYDVVEALDGRDALGKLESDPIKLALLDVNMPEIDGIELIKLIRANPVYRFLPIIMLTTESNVHMRHEGKIAGASGWIIKPFKPEKLVQTIKKFLP